MLKIKVFIYLILSFIFLSCNSGVESGKKVKEGSISYDIEYIKKTQNKLIQALLPDNIDFVFNKSQTKTSFSGDLGLYELAYYSDSKNELWSIVYRLKRNTYLYKQDLYEDKLLAHDIKIIEITETSETKRIANYDCKKIILKTDSEKHKESVIYYTDKIRFQFPILLNLFGRIDGVLMDFELPQGDMLMHITAQSVNDEEVSNTEFEIPEEAQEIKQKMMMDLLDTEF